MKSRFDCVEVVLPSLKSYSMFYLYKIEAIQIKCGTVKNKSYT